MKRISHHERVVWTWYVLTIPMDASSELHIEKPMIEWCVGHHSTGQFAYAWLDFEDVFFFENLADAAAFRLAFSDYAMVAGK